jgi:preprotein translocase subunit SecA
MAQTRTTTGLPLALSWRSAYAERSDSQPGWPDRLAAGLQQRLLQPLLQPLAARLRAPAAGLRPILALADAHAPACSAASDAGLRAMASPLRAALHRQGISPALAGQALALWRELAWRQLGLRAHGVQMMGAWALLQGRLAEMATGEGKTLTAALATGAAALAGLPVHVVTVNDYLAQRDADSLRPLFGRLGLQVGCVVQGMAPAARRAAYACDITYCSNKELAFDYLKDQVALQGSGGRLQRGLDALAGSAARPALLLRGLHFAIVDEADSVLIDEARTPLILSASSGAPGSDADARHALALAQQLQAGLHHHRRAGTQHFDLTAAGLQRLAQLTAGQPGLWASPRARREQVEQALAALHLFQRDQHYLVHDGAVQIIDEFTGRVMPDRAWQAGLHQMIEAKEGCPPTADRVTLARITYQRLFSRYLLLAGMSGTLQEVASEIASVYGPRTVVLPPHRPPRRLAWPGELYATTADKWAAVVDQVRAVAVGQGRPVLLGTRSVAASEQLSAALTAAGIAHALLNARQDQAEAGVVARAGQTGQVTVATNMAGRGTDIRLGDGVAERGGLHVILTECHASSRIDRQLFGRCARQGEPGSVAMQVSLDDELLRPWAASPWLRRPGAGGRIHLPQPLLRLLCRRAQAGAQRQEAAIRRQTLQHDKALDRALAFTGPRT